MSAADLLTTVVAAARRAADERRREQPADLFDRAVADGRPRGDRFADALRAPGIRIIAECKRRSPSRGILRTTYDPVAIAAAYETGGAAAISVLTEPTFFVGSLDHLRAVRNRVGLPILRKDFIVTAFQVHEARAAGADAVLLIVAALDQPTLQGLVEEAAALDLAALVEVHDRAELERALDAGASLVGVNSRNLRSLAVRVETFDEIGAIMPAGPIAVAESGLRSSEDLARLRAARYDAFLIGERFMTESDPGDALGRLRRAAEESG